MKINRPIAFWHALIFAEFGPILGRNFCGTTISHRHEAILREFDDLKARFWCFLDAKTEFKDARRLLGEFASNGEVFNQYFSLFLIAFPKARNIRVDLAKFGTFFLKNTKIQVPNHEIFANVSNLDFIKTEKKTDFLGLTQLLSFSNSS